MTHRNDRDDIADIAPHDVALAMGWLGYGCYVYLRLLLLLLVWMPRHLPMHLHHYTPLSHLPDKIY